MLFSYTYDIVVFVYSIFMFGCMLDYCSSVGGVMVRMDVNVVFVCVLIFFFFVFAGVSLFV